eukprot:scaffold128280_cov57-Phaeocystis_antarctica.AAC.3
MTGDEHVAVHWRRLRDRACQGLRSGLRSGLGLPATHTRDRACQRRRHRLACRIVHAGVALEVRGDWSVPNRAVAGHHLGRPPRSHKVKVVHRHRQRVRHHARRRRHRAQC